MYCTILLLIFIRLFINLCDWIKIYVDACNEFVLLLYPFQTFNVYLNKEHCGITKKELYAIRSNFCLRVLLIWKKRSYHKNI